MNWTELAQDRLQWQVSVAIIMDLEYHFSARIYEGWNFNSGNNFLQLIQNRYMFRSFTVLQCSHQHCVQPVASDVEVVGYL